MKMWHTPIKRNEICTKWMELEKITLSEDTGSEKQLLHVISQSWSLASSIQLSVLSLEYL